MIPAGLHSCDILYLFDTFMLNFPLYVWFVSFYTSVIIYIPHNILIAVYFAPGLHFINSRGDMFLKRINISAGIFIYNSRAETASINDMP